MNFLEIIKSITFLLVLLNPFLLIVYLRDIIKKKSAQTFSKVLIRASLISFVVFSLFAVLGDSIFQNVFNASFASFQIFGGIIFLITGVQFVFKGSASIESLRGETKHVTGAIAMPIFIGPGTISYSVFIGQNLNTYSAILAIAITLILCSSFIMILKKIHDKIQLTKEELIEQYMDIAGRVVALLIGTISIELIMKGIHFWVKYQF